MKKVKKLMALLLSVIMVLAMGMTAFAAEATKGSLTVKVNDKNTLEGQTIKVYKLFDLSVSGDKYAYTVNDEYKALIAQVLGLEGTATSEELYNKLAGYTSDSPDVQKFADDFTTAALNNKTTETETSNKITDAVESYTFNDLAYGYYLVYQTGTKEIQSSLVSVNGPTVEVSLKGEAPSIEKTANAETVEIGQVVTYTIKGIIPDTIGYNEYVYTIKDTLTTGLDFVKNAQGEAQVGTDYAVSVKIGEGQTTSQTAKLSGDNNRTMTLDLSQWIRDNQTSKGQKFTVTYYAKVNENAVVTEKNSAELEYGNDPDNTTTTTPSEAKTPTYPLQIRKFARGDEQNFLDGATFRLYTSEEDAKGDKNPIGVTGGNGDYTVDKNSQNFDMLSVKTEITTGTNLKLNGLAAGTYWLVETKAPDGYNGITAPIKITIKKSGDTDVNNWTISKGDTPVDDKIIDIENSTGTILPGTGGMGTILFTVVGVALVLVIAASFVISRRKRA